MLGEDFTDGVSETMNALPEELKNILKKRWETSQFLTDYSLDALFEKLQRVWEKRGYPRERTEQFRTCIEQIEVELSDGTKETCGLVIGEQNRIERRAERSQENDLANAVTLIFNTHMNETAGLDAAGYVLENLPAYIDDLRKNGKRINMISSGQKEITDEFFRRVAAGDVPSISASELEIFRNTSKGHNCNRVVKKRISPPDSTSGSPGWNQQKHEALQVYIERSIATLDFHTTSNPAEPLIMVFGLSSGDLFDQAELFAHMGATAVFDGDVVGTSPTSYFSQRRSPYPYSKEPICNLLIECGQHFDMLSGEAAKNAARGVLQQTLDIELSQVRDAKIKDHTLQFLGPAEYWYAPLSCNADRNPPGYADLPKGCKWDPDAYLHCIYSVDALPQHVQERIRHDDIRVAKNLDFNGSIVRKGEAVAYTYCINNDNKREVAFLYAPYEGRVWMARQNNHVPPDDPYDVFAVTRAETLRTVSLQGRTTPVPAAASLERA